MNSKFNFLLGICIVSILSQYALSEIHRSRPSFKAAARREEYLKSLQSPKKPAEKQQVLINFGNLTLLSWCILSAVAVGLTGILPILILPVDAGVPFRENSFLKVLLSFAVGGLLGDVFLHLLPETWSKLERSSTAHFQVGAWVLIGMLSFLVLEKLFTACESDDTCDSPSEKTVTAELTDQPTQAKTTEIEANLSPTTEKQSQFIYNAINGYTGPITRSRSRRRKEESHLQNGVLYPDKESMQIHEISKFQKCGSGDSKCNGFISNGVLHADQKEEQSSTSLQSSVFFSHIKVSGYLNLFANCIDNFTHGLALGGAYSCGPRIGVITTLAIILHEIPHEVGDFAILLRSGFSRYSAAKAQICTACFSLVGISVALLATSAQDAGERTAWILPFTGGGFLYIALVSIIPDILKETSPVESLKQLLAISCGIAAMGCVTLLFE